MWRNKNYYRSTRLLGMLTLVALLTACGSKRTLTDDANQGNTSAVGTSNHNTAEEALRKACLSKVGQHKISSANLVSNIDFRFQSGSKDLTVGGKLSMRRDEVIRIQLVPFGLAEVGRVEFTKDSVLFMDRLHKRYVRGAYKEVAFLRDNGIDFYALQALFWNQLYVVGGKSLETLNVTKPSDAIWKLQYTQDKMDYAWWAETTSGLIRESVFSYRSGSQGTSQFKWTYDNFQTFGKDKFPASHTAKFKGAKKDVTLQLTLGSMKNDSKWEARTQVPSKYKTVSIDEVLDLITKI